MELGVVTVDLAGALESAHNPPRYCDDWQPVPTTDYGVAAHHPRSVPQMVAAGDYWQ